MTLVEKNWTSLRTYLLFFLLGSALTVLIKMLFLADPNNKSPDQIFSFPSTVPLKGWQFVSSGPAPKNPTHQIYRYRQGEDRLTIDAENEYRFDGGSGRQLMQYYNVKIGSVALTEKYIPNKGYIAIFQKDQDLYLTSCLNPVGQSTVNDQEFFHNRYRYGWSPKRTLLWLMGQEDIFDGRCLWTNISTPLSSKSDLTQAADKLERAWLEWSNFWQGRW